METVNGVPVTEEMIQAWADEAEHGYDVEQLRRRGRTVEGATGTNVIPVSIDRDLLSAVDEQAERDHTSRENVIQAALRSYVA